MQQGSCCLKNGVEINPAIRIANNGARSHTALVVTCRDFLAAPEAVWKALMFYEEVTERAPFFLRSLLPTPIGSEGCKSEVGSEVRCRYLKGNILKRVTRIVHGRSYSFDVVEQNLTLHGRIRVLGGDYLLYELAPNRTRVTLSTRYESPNQPRWLFGALEATVCHSFHRHILTAMRSTVRQG